MSKKIILVLGEIILFLGCGWGTVNAEVVINEIMYAPENGANYEWVEIYNSGSDSMDLTDWRFFHGETTSGPLTLRSGSSSVLGAGDYAIIAKSPSVVGDYNWLSFSGLIFSASTLSLPDSGDNTYIAIASDATKTTSDAVTYDPALGGSKESGNSLSKISGVWKDGVPTPGVINQAASSGGNENEDGENEGETNEEDGETPVEGFDSSSSAKKTETKPKATVPKIKVEITAKTIAYTGIPFSFRGIAIGKAGEQLFHGRYFWNFGDGDFRETKVINEDKFTHTYFYPGDYTVLLEYYPNHFAEVPDATDTLVIKVVKPVVSISAVGNEQDFFVELHNSNTYDIDISGWILTSDYGKFIIPKNTILGAQKKMTLSPWLTKFSLADKNSLKLATREGNPVFDYKASLVPPTPSIDSAYIIYPKISKADHQDEKKIVLNKPDLTEALGENLVATALASENAENETERSGTSFLFSVNSLVLLLFVGFSASVVYFLRQNRTPVNLGSDFEILDE